VRAEVRHALFVQGGRSYTNLCSGTEEDVFPSSRRELLKQVGCGFGYLALAGLATERAGAAPLTLPSPPSDGGEGRVRGAKKPPHFRPRAKRILFLFMQGGVSHVDSYDYKPLLDKHDGKAFSFDDARVLANTGKRGSTQRVMKPLWKFSRHGQCGRWAST